MHSLLGGWQLSDLTSFQTGNPFSIVNNSSNADNAGTGNTVSAKMVMAQFSPMLTSLVRFTARSRLSTPPGSRDLAFTTATRLALRRA